MTDAELMRMAIGKAGEGIDAGQTPFGACIARNGEVLACEHNRVWETTDSTAHAEIVAIRAACRKLGAIDLSGCTIYSTTEPCPMCFGAIHWARIGAVYYGTGIRDAAKAGFHELRISNTRMKALGRSRIRLVPGFLREECLELFRSWLVLPGRKLY